MANIQEKIAKKFPSAVFSADNSAIPQITIDDANLHSLALALRDDCGMDYLVTIAGVDHVDSLGAIY